MTDIANLRRWLEGAYELLEWHMADGIKRAPEVAGRFVLLNGAVTTILHDRTREYSHSMLAHYGYYTLSTSEFSYRYDSPTLVIQKDGDTQISRADMWKGMRTFTVEAGTVDVRLRSASSHAFHFDKEGLRYFEADKVLRVWTRIGG